MDQVYIQELMEHYRHPQNQGKLKDADIVVSETNSSCGDWIKIYLKLDKKKRVKQIKFLSQGCVISTAAASILSEAVKGKKLEKIKKLTSKDLIKLVGIQITPGRIKCLMLPLVALIKGIEKLPQGEQASH
jgi:nitrogen fixation NifU-like protein